MAATQIGWQHFDDADWAAARDAFATAPAAARMAAATSSASLAFTMAGGRRSIAPF